MALILICLNTLPFVKPVLKANSTKTSLPTVAVSRRADELIQLVHSDLCEKSLGGA